MYRHEHIHTNICTHTYTHIGPNDKWMLKPNAIAQVASVLLEETDEVTGDRHELFDFVIYFIFYTPFCSHKSRIYILTIVHLFYTNTNDCLLF